MLEDAKDVPSGATLSVDLCIVGAGAAGISLALQFAGHHTSVLLAESGGMRAEAATQALYAGQVAASDMHSAPDKYQQRRFGGSTTVWGGRCVPFDPIDFEARPWRPEAACPIGFDALAPYYEHANTLCEAGRFAYTVCFGRSGQFQADHQRIQKSPGIDRHARAKQLPDRFRSPLSRAASFGRQRAGAAARELRRARN